jgi:hypothetical protein
VRESERRSQHRGATRIHKSAESERKKPEWSAFPLGDVEMAEAAAALLRFVAMSTGLAAALKDDALAEQRLALALAQCRLCSRRSRGAPDGRVCPEPCDSGQFGRTRQRVICAAESGKNQNRARTCNFEDVGVRAPLPRGKRASHAFFLL